MNQLTTTSTTTINRTTNENNFYMILTSAQESRYQIDFDKPIELSTKKHCALFGLHLPALHRRSIKCTLKIVYIFSKFIGGIPSGKWYFNDHIITQFTYQPFIGDDSYSFYYTCVTDINLIIQDKIGSSHQIIKLLSNIDDRFKNKNPDQYKYVVPKLSFEQTNDEKRASIVSYTGHLYITEDDIDRIVILFWYDDNARKIFKIDDRNHIPEYIDSLSRTTDHAYDTFLRKEMFRVKERANYWEKEVYYSNLDYYKNFLQTQFRVLVECNIVCESYYNQQKKRILRELIIDHHGNIIGDELKNLIYIPVDVKYIKSLNLRLFDESYTSVWFKQTVYKVKNGKATNETSIAVLHFMDSSL